MTTEQKAQKLLEFIAQRFPDRGWVVSSSADHAAAVGFFKELDCMQLLEQHGLPVGSRDEMLAGMMHLELLHGPSR